MELDGFELCMTAIFFLFCLVILFAAVISISEDIE